MASFEQDIQEFTKPVAKLICQIPEGVVRNVYREERRAFIACMCGLLDINPIVTYAEYLNGQS